MPLLAAMMISALTAQAGPQQAFACSCATLPDSPARAREYMETSDALVLAEVVERTANEPFPAARVRVERVYAGNVGGEISVTSANCNGLIVDFRPGERWLMTLDQRDGGWQAHGCSAGLVDGVTTSRYNDGDVWLAAMNEIAPWPESTAAAATVVEEDDGGASTATISMAVAGLATLALVVTYIAQRRTRAR